MRIKLIRLKDFQVHEDLEVKFSPNITSIQGPTDRGKSAIIRALRWVCLNDFPGDEFIRDGAKTATATIRIESNQFIQRKKGAGGNVYLLDEEQFKSFGLGVPDSISKLLSLDEINFQAQHDPSFWFSKTAGEVSRHLNAIIDLSVIDTSMAKVSATVRKHQERKSFHQEELEKIDGKLEALKKDEKRIEDFYTLKQARDEYQKAIDNYRGLQDTIYAISLRADNCRKLEGIASAVEEVYKQAKEFRARAKDAEELETILQKIERLGEVSAPPDLSEVEKAFEQWKELESESERLARLVDRVAESTLAYDSWLDSVKMAEKRFHQGTSGQHCPACGQIIRS